MTKASRAVDAMMARKVDLSKLEQAGTYPDTLTKCALELASAMHRAESTDCAVSWAAQKRAQDFVNEHGLGPALDEMFRLEKPALPEEV